MNQSKAKELLKVSGSPTTKEDNAIKGKSQTGRVLHTMMDGEWHTLYELRHLILEQQSRMDSESGISARIRDLRNKFGLMVISRARRPSQAHEYKLIDPTEAKQHDLAA